MKPRTEAGWAFLDEWFGYIDTFPDAAIERDDATTGILAIEAEALSAYKAELREKVEGLPFAERRVGHGPPFPITNMTDVSTISRSAVLALLDSPDQETA